MKISPPWSRRRCTQPATRTSLPDVVGAQLAGPVRAVAVGSRRPHARLRPSRRPRPRTRGAAGARVHVLDLDLVSDNHDRTRAESVRLLQLPLHAPAGLLHLRAQAAACGAARRAGRRHGRRARPRTRRLPRSCSAVARRQQHPLDARRPAHARGRRAAQLLDQAVVAAAAAERRLGAEALGLELEHRARVVVEPAHERGVDLVRHPGPVEQRPHLGEVLGVVGASRSTQARRLRHHRLGAGVVGVERAQRVLLEPRAHLLRQLALARAQVSR